MGNSLNDLEYSKFDSNGNVKVALGTASVVVDAEIGAVELKDGTTDVRVTAKVDNAAAGTPTPLSVGGKYNLAAQTYDDGDQVTTQYDANGYLRTVIQSGQSKVTGNISSEDADSGEPVKVGGIYNGTAKTYTSGDRTNLEADINGNVKTTLATGIAGEDLTNDVLKTEQRFSYYHHVGTAGAVLGTVKSGAGFLHSVVIGNHTAGGTYTLFDSIGTSATVISIISSAGAVSPLYVYNVSFATGLTISSGSVADVTVSYR